MLHGKPGWMQLPSALRSTATAINIAPLGRFLDGRTSHITIRAIDAAIALQRTQNRRTMWAVIEKLARVRWHSVGGTPAALRTSEGGGRLCHAGPIALMI